jgi:uncharacterized protein involved in exopolysaccharide biosynthesis
VHSLKYVVARHWFRSHATFVVVVAIAVAVLVYALLN